MAFGKASTYDLANRVRAALSAPASNPHMKDNRSMHSAVYQTQKASAQKMSRYPETPTDNLKKQGVGATSIGVTGAGLKKITNIKTGNQLKRMYPVHIINKAAAKMGGNSSADGR